MSSSHEIEAEIKQLESIINPISSQLDEKVVSFATVLPQTVENWMNEETKRQIVDNAQKVNDAGVDTLKQLKSELTSLFKKLPEICNNAIANKSEWPHRCSIKQKIARSNEAYFPSVFRTAISPLGALLNKYNFLKVPEGHSSTWEKVSEDQFRYAINPGFDYRNYKDLVEYVELREKQTAQIKELEIKRQELTKAKARELWENA